MTETPSEKYEYKYSWDKRRALTIRMQKAREIAVAVSCAFDENI